MRNALVWIPLAFVAGGLVGAWSPTEELRALRRREAEKPVERAPAQAGAFNPIAQMVNLPAMSERRNRPRPAAEAEGERAPEGTNGVAAAEGRQERPGRPDARRPDPEEFEDVLEKAADAWKARAEVVRATTLEKLGIGEEGAARFDEAVAAMNDRVRETMLAMAEELANAKTLTPELGVRFMGDLSAAVAATYDDIGACADADRRDDVAALMLTDFIDPMVAEPLIAVQDKLTGPMARGGRR